MTWAASAGSVMSLGAAFAAGPSPSGGPPAIAASDRIDADPGDLRDFNVLIVSADTMRADHVGCYGYRPIDTPVINALARGGAICETAVTPSPSTLPAHASLLTGLYPGRHGARANGTFRLDDGITTLAERLRAAGYATAAFISAAVLDSRYGLDQGFDLYDDDLTRGRKFSDHMFRERPAEVTNEPAIAWLRERDGGKFFLWVHYFDAHAVYLPPEPYFSRYRDRLYDGEIAYVDSQTGALLRELERLGLRERTLVVFTSDHGEGLGEHGEQTHSLLVYDSTLRVPLILNAPGCLRPGRIRRAVSLVDVAPTVLSLLGVPLPQELDGVSLTEEAPAEPRALAIETIATMTLHGWAPLLGVRRDDFKYILAPTPELYDLRRDPGETRNIHSEDARTAALLGAELARIMGADPFLAAGAIKPNLAVDERTRRELAALGYLATAVGAAPAGPARDPKEMIHHWEKLQRGLNLQAQGRMREALPILEECVADVEGDIFARQVLAGCHLMRWEFDRALEIAGRSAELEPHDETVRLSMAAAHLGRGDLEAAERAVEEALAIEPQSAQAYLHKGRIALRRGDEELALAHYRRALEMDPGTVGPGAWDEIGWVHLRARRLDEALQAFREALRIDALDGAAHDGLANVLIEEQRLAEAELELAAALRFDPNQPLALATMAALRIERGDLEGAIQLAERGLELSPKLPQAHTRLGLAWRRKGRADLAEAHYLKAIEHGPWLDAAHVNLAQLRLSQGRADEAMQQFESALRANPYCAVALANLGARHFNEGRPDQAFALYRRALRVNPDYALVHKNIASIHALRDDPHRTALHLRRSLELDPGQPQAEQLRYLLAQAEREAAGRPEPEGFAAERAEAVAGPSRGGAAALVAARPGGATVAPPPSAGPWNLLLVTLDTTRADHLGCYGYAPAGTPSIDGLASAGVTFARCSAPAPLTLPSHCSIMTGWWPPRHGVRVNGAAALSERAVTLAEVLRAGGYATAAVIGAAVLDAQFGLDQGFDHYDDEVSGDPAPGPFDYAERDASAVTDAAIGWLRQERQAPYLLWVHYFDPHAPYEPPGFQSGLETRTGYDAEIAFTDSQLGRLLEAAEPAGSGRGTLVVVTADHGEGLWEHGEPTHGLFAYESTLRVPLIGRFPDRRQAGRRIVEPVSLVDLMPSILSWLSVKAPAELDGRVLPLENAAPPGPAPRAIYFENRAPAELYRWSALSGIVQGTSKLIMAPRPELYDLALDPHELTNLYAEGSPASSAMHARLQETLQGLSSGSSAGAAPVNLTEQDEARLRALGYLGGWAGAVPAGEAPPAGPDPKDMVRVYWRVQVATTLVSERSFAEAADVLGVIVREDPGNRRAALLLAELANHAGAAAPVADALQGPAARRYDPEADLYIRGQLGLALAALGRDREAADAFRAAIEIDPGSLPARLGLATALERLGAPAPEVIPHLERLVELAPGEARFAAALAEAYDETGDRDRAAAMFRRAIELAGAGATAPPWLAGARKRLEALEARPHQHE